MVRTSQPCPYLWTQNPDRVAQVHKADNSQPWFPAQIQSQPHSSLDHTTGEEWDMKTDFLQTSLTEGSNAPSLSSASWQLCCASSACVLVVARLRYRWALPSTCLSCDRRLCPTAASGTQHTHCPAACPKTKKPPYKKFHSGFGEKKTEAVDLHALHSWMPLTSKRHTHAPPGGKCFINTIKWMLSSWLSSWNGLNLFN